MEHSINYWNSFIKPEESNTEAVAGDLVLEINGVLFLIQRTNDINNVVCFRIENNSNSILSAFLELREILISKNINYIRVEGNKKRYMFLKKLNLSKNYLVLQKEDEERNIFYIRLN